MDKEMEETRRDGHDDNREAPQRPLDIVRTFTESAGRRQTSNACFGEHALREDAVSDSRSVWATVGQCVPEAVSASFGDRVFGALYRHDCSRTKRREEIAKRKASEDEQMKEGPTNYGIYECGRKSQ